MTLIEIESSETSKPVDRVNRKRVVQTESDEKVKTAKKNSFLSWQNQIVDHETSGKRVALGGGAKGSPSKKEAQPSSPSLSNLGIKLNLGKSAKEEDQPRWATPGTRAEDYIKGMQEADRTALNTSEYRYYSYFQRIRERLDRAWVPILRAKLFAYYHSGRQLASDEDHTTRVLVILNGKGEVVRVQMVSESGTRDLDDAAVAAFNKAGPFPNPPKGMVDINGQIQIPWDFILKT